MSPKVVANVHCKMCNKDFSRLEWLKNKDCDTPEVCSCPEVKKSMQHASQVINKAKTKAFMTTVTTKSIPTQFDTDKEQYYFPVEPLTVIEIKRDYSKKR